jgi:pimeloyl-ACP methyl ester carboxylesterase
VARAICIVCIAAPVAHLQYGELSSDFQGLFKLPFKAFCSSPSHPAHRQSRMALMSPLDTDDTKRRACNIGAIRRRHRLIPSTNARSLMPHRSEDAMLMQPAQTTQSSTTVIALHCSGAGAGQWRQLGEQLGTAHALIAPEHYGCDRAGPWTGSHAFTLADEAARTIELIDGSTRKVHLVGHSYGGGVALHVALARPHRIASLSLYEPSAFHLLRAKGDAGAEAFAEIQALTATTGRGVITGDYSGAAAAFIDYWSGAGAWASLRPTVQVALTRWMPKAPLDFRALIEERAPMNAYTALDFPVLVMRGEHAPRPTRQIAEMLVGLLPEAQLSVIAGAGHMGPLTHAATVSEEIAAHIRATEAARGPVVATVSSRLDHAMGHPDRCVCPA